MIKLTPLHKSNRQNLIKVLPLQKVLRPSIVDLNT